MSVIIIYKPLNDLIRLSTPDMMSTLFLVGALLGILSDRYKVAFILTFLAVLTRLDNLLFAFLILVFFNIKHFSNTNFKLRVLIFGCSLFVFLLMFGYSLSGNLDWLIKYSENFKPSMYFNHISKVFVDVPRSMLFFVLAIAIGCQHLFISREKNLLKLVITFIVLRLILVPSYQERFFVAYQIFLIVLIFNAVFLQKIKVRSN